MVREAQSCAGKHASDEPGPGKENCWPTAPLATCAGDFRRCVKRSLTSAWESTESVRIQFNCNWWSFGVVFIDLGDELTIANRLPDGEQSERERFVNQKEVEQQQTRRKSRLSDSARHAEVLDGESGV